MYVGLPLRLTAFVADYIIVSSAGHILSSSLELSSLYSLTIVMNIYTIGVSLLTKGRTAGKSLVRIKVEKSAGNMPFWLAITWRYLGRNGLLFILSLLEMLTVSVWEMQRIWVPLYFAVILFFAADLIYALLKRKSLLYERLSGTKNVSIFS